MTEETPYGGYVVEFLRRGLFMVGWWSLTVKGTAGNRDCPVRRWNKVGPCVALRGCFAAMRWRSTNPNGFTDATQRRDGTRWRWRSASTQRPSSAAFVAPRRRSPTPPSATLSPSTTHGLFFNSSFNQL